MKFEGSVFSIAKQLIHPCAVLTPRCAKRLAIIFLHNFKSDSRVLVLEVSHFAQRLTIYIQSYMSMSINVYLAK